MLSLMTKPSEIERVQFRTDETTQLLGEQASSVLGYNKLLKATGSTLRGALCKLEIPPLVTSKVEAYKLSKEKFGVWSGHKWAVFHFGLCFALALILSCSLPVSHNYPDFSFWGVVGDVFNVLSIAGIVCFQIAAWVYTFNGDLRGWRKNKKWQTYSLKGYPGAVPEFVLSKALQIKALLPEAEFQIDQLVVEREQTIVQRDPDPFLIVSLSTYNGRSVDKESYYIEVWDEKEYEHTL